MRNLNHIVSLKPEYTSLKQVEEFNVSMNGCFN